METPTPSAANGDPNDGQQRPETIDFDSMLAGFDTARLELDRAAAARRSSEPAPEPEPTPAPEPQPASDPFLTRRIVVGGTPDPAPDPAYYVPSLPRPASAPQPASGPAQIPEITFFPPPVRPSTPEAILPRRAGVQVVGMSTRVEQRRRSASSNGAADAFDAMPATERTQTKEDFVKLSRRPRAIATTNENGAVLIAGSDVGSTERPQNSQVVAMTRGNFHLPENDVPSDNPGKKLANAVAFVRAQVRPTAESMGADASLLAVNVSGDKVAIALAGNVSILTGALGSPNKRVSYIPDGEGSTVSQQGRFGRDENSLFMTAAEKSGRMPSSLSQDKVVTVGVKMPLRFVGSTANLHLEQLRESHPQDFAEAFHLADPDEASAALQALSDNYYHAPEYDGDRAIFVFDVEPGDVPAAPAPEPTPEPTPAPALPSIPSVIPSLQPDPPSIPPAQPPIVPSTPFAPIPSTSSPERNRIIDKTGLRALILLTEVANKTGGSLEDANFVASQEFIDSVESAYGDALTDYAEALAKRSDSTFYFDTKGHRKATFNYARALEARQTLGGLILEKHLSETTTLTEAERDYEITQQVIKSMLGGEVSSPIDPTVVLTVDGTVSEIGDAVHNARLEKMGWVADDVTGEMVPPSAGLRKYTTKFVDKWAEWGTQGKRGYVKRTAVMAAGGLAVTAVSFATAGVANMAAGGAATIGSTLATTSVVTRVSRALVGTKLNKQSSTLTQARQDRTNHVENIRLDYESGAANETVLRGYERRAIQSGTRNGRRAIIGMVTMAAAGTAGEFARPVFDYVSDHVSSFFGGHASAAAPQTGASKAPEVGGRPSATPTQGVTPKPSGTPSASPSSTPSHSAGASQSAEPTPRATAPEVKPSQPSTGGGIVGGTPDTGGHTPGTGNGGEAAPTGNGNATQLKVGNSQSVSEVLSNAKGGNFSENWQTMLDSAKSAQSAGQLRVVHLQNGNFYYQSMVNGHWTDNTTEVVKTLSKFSKGKFALAA